MCHVRYILNIISEVKDNETKLLLSRRGAGCAVFTPRLQVYQHTVRHSTHWRERQSCRLCSQRQ